MCGYTWRIDGFAGYLRGDGGAAVKGNPLSRSAVGLRRIIFVHWAPTVLAEFSPA